MTTRKMETGYWEIRNWELNYQYPIPITQYPIFMLDTNATFK